MKLGQKLAVGYLRAQVNLLAMVSKKKAAAKAFQIFCTPLKKSRRRRPTIFNRGEKLVVKVGGLRIQGHRWNAYEQKKCLIVHGFESTSYKFERFIHPLEKKGYQVLAFDAPAHGKSDGQQITLPLYVETLRTIYTQFGPIDCFIAHSFGGLALTHFIETIPNKEMKVVLVAPATETVTAIDSFFNFLHLGKNLRPEFDKLIFDKGGKWPSEYSIRRAMQHIKSDVLWIHDEDDQMTPLADALKLKDDNHAHIQFMITKGLGHRRIYRDSTVVKRILEFL